MLPARFSPPFQKTQLNSNLPLGRFGFSHNSHCRLPDTHVCSFFAGASVASSGSINPLGSFHIKLHFCIIRTLGRRHRSSNAWRPILSFLFPFFICLDFLSPRLHVLVSSVLFLQFRCGQWHVVVGPQPPGLHRQPGLGPRPAGQLCPQPAERVVPLPLGQRLRHLAGYVQKLLHCQ